MVRHKSRNFFHPFQTEFKIANSTQHNTSTSRPWLICFVLSVCVTNNQQPVDDRNDTIPWVGTSWKKSTAKDNYKMAFFVFTLCQRTLFPFFCFWLFFYPKPNVFVYNFDDNNNSWEWLQCMKAMWNEVLRQKQVLLMMK